LRLQQSSLALTERGFLPLALAEASGATSTSTVALRGREGRDLLGDPFLVRQAVVRGVLGEVEIFDQ
jgi:hypothetical protein